MTTERIIIKESKILGMLPDPLLLEDGNRVKTKEDWERRKKEIYKTVIELQYGTMPPQPEFLEVEKLWAGRNREIYRIDTGTYEHPISMKMTIVRPEKEELPAVIVSGDAYWHHIVTEEWIQRFSDNGLTLVLFERIYLTPDLVPYETKGPIYDTYPEYSFGAVGAWAWGYSRCVDALEKLGTVNLDCIVFTGHSRGGKTALLAGVLDDRAKIVHSNGSGAGGSGCYRMEMQVSGGDDDTNEKISDFERFGILRWFGPELAKYQGKEEKLPFDQHFLKAMVAPRIYLETNGEADIWVNLIGTWQTSMAAKEVYRFLDAEDQIYSFYRKGGHLYTEIDFMHLLNIIRHHLYGEKVEGENFGLSYRPENLIFDWRWEG